MSLIDDQTAISPIGIFSGFSTMSAIGTTTSGGRARFNGKTEMAATGSILLVASAVFVCSTQIYAFGRLGSDANLFGAGSFAGKTEMTATGSITQIGSGVFAGKTEMAATGKVVNPQISKLRLIVDVLPIVVSNNYQDYAVRLKMNDVAIPIESWALDAPDNSAGKTFSATIARFSDRAAFTNSAAIKFEIDLGDGFYTEFEGILTEKNSTLANENNRPNDSFSFTAADASTDRLSYSPTRTTIIYDPARETINVTDYEPLYDTAGRAFPLDAVAVPNLSLWKLFTAIYVNRCGFSEVQSNLPDYPIRRAEVSATGTFHSAVAPHVGMFEPVVFTQGTVLWIVDATTVLPSGFPAPRQLLASKIDGLQTSQTIERVDGFNVQCSVAELGEFYTLRVDTETETVGNSGDDGFTRTIKKTYVREYRIANQPGVVVGEVNEKEVTQIFDSSSNVFPIDETTETYGYDSFGRQKKTTKVVKKDTPDLPGGETSSLKIVRSELSTVSYGINPFFPSKQIQKKNEMIATGLIALDSEVQFLGKDFPQDFIKATEAGNLKDTTALVTGTLESVVDTFKPLRNGQVIVKRIVTDFTPTAVGRKPIVTESPSQPRSGDVSLKGQGGGRQIVRIVYPSDDYTPTRAVREDFAVGELPLEFAIPLARRRLLRKTSINQRISPNVVGLDRSIERGSLFSVYNRETEEEGKLIVEGYKKHGDESKTYMVLRGRQI